MKMKKYKRNNKEELGDIIDNRGEDEEMNLRFSFLTTLIVNATRGNIDLTNRDVANNDDLITIVAQFVVVAMKERINQDINNDVNVEEYMNHLIRDVTSECLAILYRCYDMEFEVNPVLENVLIRTGEIMKEVINE